VAFTLFGLGACNCANCTVTFHVAGCKLDTVDTLTVSVYDSTDTTLLASGTTSTGIVALSWAGSTGTYHVHVTGQNARFAAYNVSQTLTCGGTTGLQLQPATGYGCPVSPVCILPIANTLTCTFSVGGALTLTSSGGMSAIWSGSFVVGGFTYVINWDGTLTINVFLGGSPVATCGVLTEATTCPPSFLYTATLTTSIHCSAALGTASITE
jgi:hypothetical protein